MALQHCNAPALFVLYRSSIDLIGRIVSVSLSFRVSHPLQKRRKSSLKELAFSERHIVRLRIFDHEPLLLTSLPDGKFWDFTSDLAKGDTAYTTLALGAHTDNTYFVSPATSLIRIITHHLCADRPLRTATFPPPLAHQG
jgi:hypothetical protein